MKVSTQVVVRALFILLIFFNLTPLLAESIPEKQVTEQPAHSQADKKRLLKRFENIKTVTAVFVQNLYTDESNKPQVTEGKLLVSGGDKFRLEYTKPYEQLYIADGKQFIFYDVDLEQITIKPQSKELADTPAMILSNPVIFINNYFVKLNTEAYQEEYILTARNETSAYNKILLTFKNTRLASMQIEDSFGQETELVFKSIIYNKKIPAGTFKFSPPEGVDVIRSTPQTTKKRSVKQ